MAPSTSSGPYTHVATALPPHVTLNDVIKTIPKDVFRKNMLKAWSNVLLTLAAVSLSHALLSITPWYLLPVSWFIAGTAWTGLFVIAHDCGHLSFSRTHAVNDIVGTVMMLPLVYPFEPWRIHHNLHHTNTNKLHVDNAWQPFQTSYYETAPALEKAIMRVIKGPLWWIASVGHQIKIHFLPSLFTPEQRPRVYVSIVSVFAFAALFFPAALYNYGLWWVVKYWLVPWIGFHFWMSTFTMVHHTLPHIPFLPEEKWNDAKARLNMTVHCEYPAWIELLTHSINVHIPHHVSTAIPSYNLRAAHEALKKNWSQYMHECVFGMDLLKDITSNCHLYHEDEMVCYVPFESNGEMVEERKTINAKKFK